MRKTRENRTSARAHDVPRNAFDACGREAGSGSCVRNAYNLLRRTALREAVEFAGQAFFRIRVNRVRRRPLFVVIAQASR